MNSQLSLFSDELTPRKLSIEVPMLPSGFRYVDDFTDTDYYFSDFDLSTWPLSINGLTSSLRFEKFSEDAALQKLIKVFATDLIVRFAPGTTRFYVDGLALLDLHEIVGVIESAPEDSRELWDILLSKRYLAHAYLGLKALLRFAAERSIGTWTPLYLPYISSSLPLLSCDKFAAVRSGDVFIGVEDEATLVRWIYERSNNAAVLTTQELLDTAIVICSYQFAMRPKQIGLLKREDCRVLYPQAGGVMVHLTFRMIKQLTDASTQMPLIRKVKREWATIFAEVFTRGKNNLGSSKLLGFASAAAVCKRLSEVLFKITLSNWSATDLRHSGAMRQVDAGASAEDLAEFMGHSTLESGLVYFDASATQAERVNKALGLSETYQNLAKLGTHRFISNDELSNLKGDQQIAGVPHGIPIAGIGGCQTGQPSCPYNPITACYGCPKFLPVNDTTIHRKVLEDFRGVVRFFYDSSRGETTSPAYLQLQRTISEVDAVIQELENFDEQ